MVSHVAVNSNDNPIFGAALTSYANKAPQASGQNYRWHWHQWMKPSNQRIIEYFHSRALRHRFHVKTRALWQEVWNLIVPRPWQISTTHGLTPDKQDIVQRENCYQHNTTKYIYIQQSMDINVQVWLQLWQLIAIFGHASVSKCET